MALAFYQLNHRIIICPAQVKKNFKEVAVRWFWRQLPAFNRKDVQRRKFSGEFIHVLNGIFAECLQLAVSEQDHESVQFIIGLGDGLSILDAAEEAAATAPEFDLARNLGGLIETGVAARLITGGPSPTT